VAFRRSPACRGILFRRRRPHSLYRSYSGNGQSLLLARWNSPEVLSSDRQKPFVSYAPLERSSTLSSAQTVASVPEERLVSPRRCGTISERGPELRILAPRAILSKTLGTSSPLYQWYRIASKPSLFKACCLRSGSAAGGGLGRRSKTALTGAL